MRAIYNAEPAVQAAPTNADTCPFILKDRRRFPTVIDEIVAGLRQEGTWKGDCSQQRRILRSFAWITGDKPLGVYPGQAAVAGYDLDEDEMAKGVPLWQIGGWLGHAGSRTTELHAHHHSDHLKDAMEAASRR